MGGGGEVLGCTSIVAIMGKRCFMVYSIDRK